LLPFPQTAVSAVRRSFPAARLGGGDLVGQFADVGLLDEVIVSIAPVTLGRGAPLLPRRVELRLDELGRALAAVLADEPTWIDDLAVVRVDFTGVEPELEYLIH
jgi:hypothetical protein